MMIKKCLLLIVVCTIGKLYSQGENLVEITGEKKKWHKITLIFEGFELSEYGKENPFLDYRLSVTFRNKDKIYVIPGFYSADGNAAESSADRGKVWQVRFRPDEIGEWSYIVSFKKGKQIALSDDVLAGEALLFDGYKGSFLVKPSDKKGKDFRAKGRLLYTNKGYLQFAETGEYFLKGGAGSPENFLGYYEFDQTPPSHKYIPHLKDWKQGDPTWQNGKGKNIIGALNYLSQKKMNSVYFLTMNVQGDGKDTWPWSDINERYRFDCSKLDQWEIVFDHMDKLGIMLHMVTQETENELLLDIGELGVQRKLYYRELIARFGHHLGVIWNLGEENGALYWTPKGQTDGERMDMAEYIKTHDPYKNLVVLHTHSSSDAQDLYLEPLLGFEFLDGPSMQTHEPNDVHERVKKWIELSKTTGKRWIACQDEIGPAGIGAKPDKDDLEHNEMRSKVLWGNLMAGGAGVDWYFGYKYAHNDLKCEDWRSRDKLWDQTYLALNFFQKHLPFSEMKNTNGLTSNPDDYVFAQNGKVYAIYLPKITETKLNLYGSNSKFNVFWYNPRKGGKLLKGTKKIIKGGHEVSIGFPPEKEGDWVALLVNSSKKNSVSQSNETISYLLKRPSELEKKSNDTKKSLSEISKKQGQIIYHFETFEKDTLKQARLVFKGGTGIYNSLLNTINQNNEDYIFKVLINGLSVAEYEAIKSKKKKQKISHRLGKIYLQKGDIIEVVSSKKDNDKVSRVNGLESYMGWVSLELFPVNNRLKKELKEQLKDAKPFVAKGWTLEVEAEDFHYKSRNNSKREWYIRTKTESLPFNKDSLTYHYDAASKGAYIEALPDTRITHSDPLRVGENFYPEPGKGGIVSYKVKIKSPGKYYVWVRAYSTGSEDNGLHVGVNGEWPETGARIQLCKGKNQWTWSSAQRIPENHCGNPQSITLNFVRAGEYIVSFAMREDGFELDKWVLAKSKNYMPE